MFMIREYAACVLLVLLLGVVFLALFGIGYLLQAGGRLAMRSILAAAVRATKPRVAEGTLAVSATRFDEAIESRLLPVGAP